ncbi:MAG TPA: pitrilysin family protein, partial [Opitutaceae bacterium]|nr:pitrilysin family protein [Opitutaceae bacterium]
YLTLVEKLKVVTAADVQRVAQAYFKEDQSTTGWFIPQQEAPPAKVGAGGGFSAPKPLARGPHYYRDAESRSLLAGDGIGSEKGLSRAGPPLQQTPTQAGGGAGGGALIAPKVKRRTIAGVDVVTLKTSMKDVVTIRGVLAAGDVFNPAENSAIADLAAGMIDKGTVQHDKFAVAEMLEQAGATLSFGTGTHTLNFSGKCLRKDLPLVLGLLAEQLRTPRFDADEFAKLKKQVVGRFKRQLEDTDFRAENAFQRVIYPAGHPNRPPAEDKYLADVESATLEQVKAFHAAHYGPASARIVAVGDVDDGAIDARLQETFAQWRGGRAIPSAPKVPRLAAPRSEKVNMPGKTSVSFVVGQPSGLRYADPEYQALNMATSVLGSGFFSARLLDIIRNREGLTYGIGASLSADTYNDGAWTIEATFAPDLLEKGRASVLRELRRFHDEGLTPAELETFKVTLTGSYKVALSTTGGLASTLLNTLQRGYGPEWVDEFPRRLQALSLDQVNAAIKTYVDPAKMVTVTAGTHPDAPAK